VLECRSSVVWADKFDTLTIYYEVVCL